MKNISHMACAALVALAFAFTAYVAYDVAQAQHRLARQAPL